MDLYFFLASLKASSLAGALLSKRNWWGVRMLCEHWKNRQESRLQLQVSLSWQSWQQVVLSSHKVRTAGPDLLHKGFNSLAPGRKWNFSQAVFMLTLVIDSSDFLCEIALRWMSLELSDDKSTLVQVMAWCHQATSHYLNQCLPRFMSPYSVTGPQWVNIGSCKGLVPDGKWQKS